jgi:hypothetical protein
MIASNVRIRSIELIMPLIEAFRRNFVASALQARDMTLGPHHYFAHGLLEAIEAIGSMIRGVFPLLAGNWVTAYVKSLRGQSQLLTTYEIRVVSSESS